MKWPWLLVVLGSVAFAACVYDLDFHTQGGTDGGAPLCTPGATTPCYDGPVGTEGVGACKGGTKTCTADGQSWGACLGEVLPEAPDCTSGMDLHCDGEVPACGPNVLWAKQFGGNYAIGQAIAMDPGGNVVVTGSFLGSLDFGCGTIINPGQDNAFVAELNVDGSCSWAKGFGDATTNAAPLGVAVDASGDVFVTGAFGGTIDFGGGPLASTGQGQAVFVVKLDPNGNHLWSRSYSGAAGSEYGIALDASGHVVVVGNFTGAVDFGGGPLTSAGCTDVFVVELGTDDGHQVWSRAFGGMDCQGSSMTGPPVAGALGVAIDGSDNVILTGSFSETLNFGPNPSTILTSAGLNDAFVAKLDPNGNYLWSKRFGDANDQHGTALAVDSAQNVVLTGYFDGSIDFGGDVLVGPPMISSDYGDVYLALLDPNGNHVWSKSFGNTSTQAKATSVAVDVSNNILVTGSFSGTLDFGSGPLTAVAGPGLYNVFLAKLDMNGDHPWGGRFGDGSGAFPYGIAADASGNMLLAGYFTGSIDFGTGPLTTATGSQDVFVAKLGP